MQNRQLLIKRIQPLVILLTDDARHGEMKHDSSFACCSMFLDGSVFVDYTLILSYFGVFCLVLLISTPLLFVQAIVHYSLFCNLRRSR